MAKMHSLKALHRSMKAAKVELQKFTVKTGAAEFDCLFSVRDIPYSLALTSRGANPKFFLFEVLPGYRINGYLGEKYGDLLAVLRLDGRSGVRLNPSKWLAELDQEMPTQATSQRVPKPEEIVRLRQDIEEVDRPFFDTWINHPKGRGPTSKNLDKTLLLLGREARDYSKKNRVSSRWSASETGRIWSR